MAGENEVVLDDGSEDVKVETAVQPEEASVDRESVRTEDAQGDEAKTTGVETVTVNNAPVKKTRVLLDTTGIGDARLHSLTDQLSGLQSGVSIRAVNVLVGQVERAAVELAVGATRKDVLRSMRGVGLRELQGAKTVVETKRAIRARDSGVKMRLPEERSE